MDFMESMLSNLSGQIVAIVIALIKGTLVWCIGWKLAKFITKLIKRSRAFSRLDAGVATFIGSIIEIVLKTVVVFSVISVLGVNLSAAVTALASVGLTFGLAFQGALSNFAGGFIILVFKPFKVGDYIDTHSDSGTVESIAIFHTKLRTPDNKVISIPNGTLSGSSIINYSALPERRVDFSFCVEYGSDIYKVKEILNSIANEQETLLADKGVTCEISSFENSGIQMILRFWVKSENYWSTYFKVNETVNERFKENGIIIPLPQLDVHTK